MDHRHRQQPHKAKSHVLPPFKIASCESSKMPLGTYTQPEFTSPTQEEVTNSSSEIGLQPFQPISCCHYPVICHAAIAPEVWLSELSRLVTELVDGENRESNMRHSVRQKNTVTKIISIACLTFPPSPGLFRKEVFRTNIFWRHPVCEWAAYLNCLIKTKLRATSWFLISLIKYFYLRFNPEKAKNNLQV